ncbi:trigger factor [Mycoplasmopsis columboralis]|uniref:Trigger factor n=1 Tax=Mycoplasmopsis columboralis TaxID=171282 RepID=A0A449B769_9BACT|nr:trigger factor [Mycoplasmopsis columboralis]VEU76419.1 Trigger factor [Mycoplasmopsis columboralis]
MFTTNLDKQKQSLSVTVTIAENEFLPEFEKRFKEALKTVKVPGFRPGKAPLKELEARVNYQAIHSATVDHFARKYYAQAIEEAQKSAKENNVSVLPLPANVTVEESKENKSDLLISFTVSLAPNLKEVELSKLNVSLEFTPVDAEKLLHEFASRFGSNQLFDGSENADEVTKSGDTALIDFKGFINNEPFEGGEAQEYELKLGSNSFIPGFEDQLIGKKAKEQVDVKVTFPKDYYVEDFRNKEAVFEVKIHSFTRAKEVELNEEFFKNMPMLGVSSKEELQELLVNRENIQQFNATLDTYFKNLIEELVKASNLVLPEVLYKDKFEKLQKNFNDSLKQFGVKKHEYLKLVKTTEEKVEAELKEAAAKEAKNEFAMQYLLGEFGQHEIKDEDVKDVNYKFAFADENVKKNNLYLKNLVVNVLKQANPSLVDKVEKAYSDLLK